MSAILRSPRHLRVAAVTFALFTVAVITFTAAGSSPAQAETTQPEQEIQERAERACARIPNLTTRTDNVIERLNGDATTRGSLLWLDERIKQAGDNGRHQLVEVLENRRDVRTKSLAVFEARQNQLTDLADRCVEAGVDL